MRKQKRVRRGKEAEMFFFSLQLHFPNAQNWCLITLWCFHGSKYLHSKVLLFIFYTFRVFLCHDLSVASIPSGVKVLVFIHATRSQVFSGHSVCCSMNSSLISCCYSRRYSTLPYELVHSGSPSSLSELLGTRSKSLPSVTRKAKCVYIASSTGC